MMARLFFRERDVGAGEPAVEGGPLLGQGLEPVAGDALPGGEGGARLQADPLDLLGGEPLHQPPGGLLLARTGGDGRVDAEAGRRHRGGRVVDPLPGDGGEDGHDDVLLLLGRDQGLAGGGVGQEVAHLPVAVDEEGRLAGREEGVHLVVGRLEDPPAEHPVLEEGGVEPQGVDEGLIGELGPPGDDLIHHLIAHEPADDHAEEGGLDDPVVLGPHEDHVLARGPEGGHHRLQILVGLGDGEPQFLQHLGVDVEHVGGREPDGELTQVAARLGPERGLRELVPDGLDEGRQVLHQALGVEGAGAPARPHVEDIRQPAGRGVRLRLLVEGLQEEVFPDDPDVGVVPLEGVPDLLDLPLSPGAGRIQVVEHRQHDGLVALGQALARCQDGRQEGDGHHRHAPAQMPLARHRNSLLLRTQSRWQVLASLPTHRC